MIQNLWFRGPLFVGFGYLLGSMSFAYWVTRWLKGIDVREKGSKHATTTNTIRHAGWGPGTLVFVLDAAKGFLPVFFALRLTSPGWLVALTAAAAVAGHCWPIFAGFRGGMGLATGGGALLAVTPLAFVIGVGVLVFLTLIIHHSARASVFAGILTPGVLWVLGFQGLVTWVAIAVGIIIAVRFLSDWGREYRELWLDRA